MNLSRPTTRLVHDEGEPPVDGADIKPFAEVTLVATPVELRRIAQFLDDSVAKMESLGVDYSGKEGLWLFNGNSETEKRVAAAVQEVIDLTLREAASSTRH